MLETRGTVDRALLSSLKGMVKLPWKYWVYVVTVIVMMVFTVVSILLEMSIFFPISMSVIAFIFSYLASSLSQKSPKVRLSYMKKAVRNGKVEVMTDLENASIVTSFESNAAKPSATDYTSLTSIIPTKNVYLLCGKKRSALIFREGLTKRKEAEIIRHLKGSGTEIKQWP